MSARRSVVILTDDEPNLEHFVAMLRSDGWEVLPTHSYLEAAMLSARYSPGAFLARAALLPANSADYLRELRDVAAPYRLIISESEEAILDDIESVDERLAEPFGYGALLHALGNPDGESVTDLTSSLVSDEERLPPRESRLSKVIQAMLEFSELEHDRDKLLTRGLEVVMEISRARRGSLMLQSGAGKPLEMVRRIGFPDDIPTQVVVQLGAPIAGSVAESGQALLVKDIAREFPDRPSRGYATNSCLVVPLRDRQLSLGVFNVADRADGAAFSPDDAETLRLLAGHFAVALRNAKNIEELHALTVIDPLTQLYNRRHFDRQLRQELARARRYGRQLTLALIDIDNFKAFNDVNGYVTGDTILREVARLIRRCFREVDVVTRWGGDEFAVLLPETGASVAAVGERKSYVDRVRSTLASYDFRSSVPEIASQITASVGAATFPVDAHDSDDLFRRANEALHLAKKRGANRTAMASELRQDDEFEAEL
ncbi:MAG: sensor domain-containing diguanylate cyclase [Planctomycetota bacterium]